MRYKNTDALPVKEQGEEKRCGECFHFSVCKPHTEPHETFPEVGGCKCFKNAADVVEVRHGTNDTEMHPVDEFICSECGLIMRDCCRYEIDEDDGDEICYEFEFRYCPRCGAKMDGERREK